MGYFIVGGGLVLLALGGLSAYGILQMLRLGSRARARVVSYEQRPSDQSEDQPARYPRVRYTDAQGQQHVVVLRQANGPPVPGFMLREGEDVPIRYDPSNPYKVQVDTFLWKWFKPLLLGVIGVGLVIGGLFVVVAENAPTGPRRSSVRVHAEGGTLGETSITENSKVYGIRIPYNREDNDLTILGLAQFPGQSLQPAFVLLAKLPDDQQGFLSNKTISQEDGQLAFQCVLTTSAGKDFVVQYTLGTKPVTEEIQLDNDQWALAEGRIFLVDLTNPAATVTQARTDMTDLLTGPTTNQEVMDKLVDKLKRRLKSVRNFLDE